MSCRICLEEDGTLISPCACKGTSGYVHEHCLTKWIEQDPDNPKTKCEICHSDFTTEETWSFEPCKYILQCMDCKIKNKSYWKACIYMFGFSLFLLTWSPIDYLIVTSAVSTVGIYVTGLSLIHI